MKRLTAHIGRRFAGHAELQQDFPVERDLADKMPAIVGEEHRVIGGHEHAVRPRVLVFTPGAQKVAVTIEHQHWVVAAVKDIDIVVAVDPTPPTSLNDQPSGSLAQSALTRYR